ncbi:MAG: peptidylprolyl isomerase [Patescibacteria group bacterium]|jgi:cyclophilin family peptidyl-prolyl cis-trans isomerase
MNSNKYNILIGAVIAMALVGGLAMMFFVQSNKNDLKINAELAANEISNNAQEQEAVQEESGLPNSESEISTVLTPAEQETNLQIKNNTMPTVKIQTNKGDITIELFLDDAPNTVNNFLSLAKKGFYDGVIFHRVISGFMIQGGDPTGTGSGGPGYKFADELNPNTSSYQRGYARGVVAMANSGPNTNGSQFFIMHKDYPLPNSYTIFGRVISGIETVDAIAAAKTDSSDRPIEDVVMTKVEATE